MAMIPIAIPMANTSDAGSGTLVETEEPVIAALAAFALGPRKIPRRLKLNDPFKGKFVEVWPVQPNVSR